MEKHPLHLKIPELQKSDEVQDAVEKHERLTDEELPNDPADRLEAYMSRLEKIFLNKDERVRERNLEMLKDGIYDTYIIKPEEVPESYFDLQKRVAREQGIDAENITSEMRKRMIEVVIEDQKHSLDQWIDYLTSEDAVYPTWFKYFVFQNITKLSQFDKTLGKFKKREPNTVAPYPDVFREPLAQICDVYEKVAKDNSLLKTDPQVQTEFSKSFPKLYAEKISESLAAQIESKEKISGRWIKYSQGNKADAEKLHSSLQGKGTGWCTVGDSTARTQIESGDFYVYYTENNDGDFTQPRLAIRMNGTKTIGEVRGINQHQSVEPLLQDTLDEKLKDFGPEADKYKKKSADMKQLTEIEKKTNDNQSLNKEELQFLYEMNGSIEGFGYKKDPRIEEIRSKRNLREDLPIIFDCKLEQIVTDAKELDENTVAYIGPWNPTTYNKIRQYLNTKHVYENFLDKKPFFKEIVPDPEVISAKTAISKLKEKGHYTNEYIDDLITRINWQEKLKPSYEVVSFSVGELFGDQANHTYAEIKAKAQELDLDLVPQALAPSIRLNYPKNGGYIVIASEAIRGRLDSLRLFDCRRSGDDSWFDNVDGRGGSEWSSGFRFFFVRK